MNSKAKKDEFDILLELNIRSPALLNCQFSLLTRRASLKSGHELEDANEKY